MAPIMQPPKTIDWNSPNAAYGWGFTPVPKRKELKPKRKPNKMYWH